MVISTYEILAQKILSQTQTAQFGYTQSTRISKPYTHLGLGIGITAVVDIGVIVALRRMPKGN